MAWARTLDGGRFATTRLFGLVIACVVIAFAVSQFRYYLAVLRICGAFASKDDARSLRYRRRQAWRRLQIAALSGLAGACMFVGMFAPYDLRPRLFAAAWFGVAAFGAWVILLALVDCVATWLHFGDDRRIHKAEQLALRYKMDQFQKDAIRKHEESTQSDESSERSEE